MKIVGGKCLPGTAETGAFVQAIYAGGVANQLHGELQEGTDRLLPPVVLNILVPVKTVAMREGPGWMEDHALCRESGPFREKL